MPFQWEEEEEEEESHQVPSFLSLYQGKKWGKKNISLAGNRTPVFRVTGGDTHHYTTEDSCWRVSSQRMNARDWKEKG